MGLGRDLEAERPSVPLGPLTGQVPDPVRLPHPQPLARSLAPKALAEKGLKQKRGPDLQWFCMVPPPWDHRADQEKGGISPSQPWDRVFGDRGDVSAAGTRAMQHQSWWVRSQGRGVHMAGEGAVAYSKASQHHKSCCEPGV